MSEKSNYYRVERELTHQEVIELYLKTKQELDDIKFELDEEKRNTKIWENAFEEECLEHDKELDLWRKCAEELAEALKELNTDFRIQSDGSFSKERIALENFEKLKQNE